MSCTFLTSDEQARQQALSAIWAKHGQPRYRSIYDQMMFDGESDAGDLAAALVGAMKANGVSNGPLTQIFLTLGSPQ